MWFLRDTEIFCFKPKQICKCATFGNGLCVWFVFYFVHFLVVFTSLSKYKMNLIVIFMVKLFWEIFWVYFEFVKHFFLLNFKEKTLKGFTFQSSSFTKIISPSCINSFFSIVYQQLQNVINTKHSSPFPLKGGCWSGGSVGVDRCPVCISKCPWAKYLWVFLLLGLYKKTMFVTTIYYVKAVWRQEW